MPTLDADERALLARAYGDSRASGQRLGLARTVESLDGAFTVEMLIESARDDGSAVGTATAYRAVAAMLQAGFIERVGRAHGREHYLCCETEGHHHHFVCTRCGSTTEAPCPLNRAAIEKAASAGFVVTRHEVSIFGLCGSCLHSPPAGDHGRG